MTVLEMDIIFSRFFLFSKYSPYPMIAFFFTHPVQAPQVPHYGVLVTVGNVTGRGI